MKQNFNTLKRKGLILAQKLKNAGLDKVAHDLLSCSTIIATIIDTDTHDVTHNPNLCKNRFCPICAVGKQLKNTAKVKNLLTEMQAQNQPIYATALTLTLKNVEYTDIADTIDVYKKAWSKLINRKFLKNILLGYLYYIEITYTNNGYCHPHMHVILFFKYKFAMCFSQTFWQKEWESATKANYTPQIKISQLKSINDIINYAYYCSKPMEIANIDDKILATIVFQFNHKKLFCISRSLMNFIKNSKVKKAMNYQNQQQYYKFISVWHKTHYIIIDKTPQHLHPIYPCNPNLDST